MWGKLLSICLLYLFNKFKCMLFLKYICVFIFFSVFIKYKKFSRCFFEFGCLCICIFRVKLIYLIFDI